MLFRFYRFACRKFGSVLFKRPYDITCLSLSFPPQSSLSPSHSHSHVCYTALCRRARAGNEAATVCNLCLCPLSISLSGCLSVYLSVRMLNEWDPLHTFLLTYVFFVMRPHSAIRFALIRYMWELYTGCCRQTANEFILKLILKFTIN